MAFTLNYSTDRGKVRLLIGDIDSNNAIFQDDAIDAFLSIAPGNHVKRAASLALRTIASSEIYTQKQLRILDISTNGPAEGDALRRLANDYEQQADEEEVTGAFDWAEMVNTPAQADERLYKERQRNN